MEKVDIYKYTIRPEGYMVTSQDVALFIDEDLMLDEWQLETLQRMEDNTDAEITMLVINQGLDEEAPSWFEHARHRLKNHWPWVPVSMFHRHSRKVLGQPPQRRKHHIDDTDLATDADRVFVDPIKLNRYSVEFPQEAVDAVAGSADIGVLFGFGIIKGDILTAPKHGILGFHHGDMRKYRGTLPGFWEFLHGEDVVGITLQRLGEQLDSGEVVVYNEISIRPDDTWQDIKRRLYGDISRGMLLEGVRRLSEDEFEPDELDELGEVYTHPKRLSPVLKYLLKNTSRRLRN